MFENPIICLCLHGGQRVSITMKVNTSNDGYFTDNYANTAMVYLSGFLVMSDIDTNTYSWANDGLNVLRLM